MAEADRQSPARLRCVESCKGEQKSVWVLISISPRLPIGTRSGLCWVAFIWLAVYTRHLKEGHGLGWARCHESREPSRYFDAREIFWRPGDDYSTLSDVRNDLADSVEVFLNFCSFKHCWLRVEFYSLVVLGFAIFFFQLATIPLFSHSMNKLILSCSRSSNSWSILLNKFDEVT